jgi:hypothetical protein
VTEGSVTCPAPEDGNSSSCLYAYGVAMEMLLRSIGGLQINTVALVIEVRNMLDVSMEGSRNLE